MRYPYTLPLMGALVVAISAGCSTAATAPAVTSTASAAASGASATTEVVVRDMEIVPVDVTLPAGAIHVDVTNEGPTPHNVTIRDASDTVLEGTADLRRDERGVIDASLAAGDYILFCTLPGHESLGVKAALTITP